MIEAIREIGLYALKKEGKSIDEPFWFLEITLYIYCKKLQSKIILK